MAHVLILGMTESGKTTKARQLAANYRRQGIGVIVLDPLRDPAWQADFITDDQEEFLDVFWRSRSCAAFLDEGGESVGRYDLAMQKTATRGRHCGHSCHYIAQKATQLAPIVRDQCSYLYLFRSGMQSCKLLAEEFSQDELLKGAQLRMYSYVFTSRFSQAKIIGGLSDATVTSGNRSGDRSSRRDSSGQEEGSASGERSDNDAADDAADSGSDGSASE